MPTNSVPHSHTPWSYVTHNLVPFCFMPTHNWSCSLTHNHTQLCSSHFKYFYIFSHSIILHYYPQSSWQNVTGCCAGLWIIIECDKVLQNMLYSDMVLQRGMKSDWEIGSLTECDGAYKHIVEGDGGWNIFSGCNKIKLLPISQKIRC